jgi:hypothetical protein
VGSSNGNHLLEGGVNSSDNLGRPFVLAAIIDDVDITFKLFNNHSQKGAQEEHHEPGVLFMCLATPAFTHTEHAHTHTHTYTHAHTYTCTHAHTHTHKLNTLLHPHSLTHHRAASGNDASSSSAVNSDYLKQRLHYTADGTKLLDADGESGLLLILKMYVIDAGADSHKKSKRHTKSADGESDLLDSRGAAMTMTVLIFTKKNQASKECVL